MSWKCHQVIPTDVLQLIDGESQQFTCYIEDWLGDIIRSECKLA